MSMTMKVSSALMALLFITGCTTGQQAADTTPGDDSSRPPTNQQELAPRPEEGPQLDWRVRDLPLPAIAASLIRKQMARHGPRMFMLQRGVLTLDYGATLQLANEIGSEARISRPAADEATLNQIIPPEFFDLQDQFFANAKALGAAAEAQDDAGIATHYGDLAATCIRCHSVYRKIPASSDSGEPTQ